MYLVYVYTCVRMCACECVGGRGGKWEGRVSGRASGRVSGRVSGQSLYHPEKKMIKIYGACLCDVSGEA